MIEPNSIGIITIIEQLEEKLKSLTAELPFLDDRPIDKEGVKARFDLIMEQLTKLLERATYTHVLVQSVINSIYSSRKDLRQSVDGLLRKTGDQLGKITATTEAATNKILDEAMKLDSDQNTIVDKLDEIKGLSGSEDVNTKLESVKTMIYDNQDSVFNIIQFLQFQDITAQQIKGAYSLLHDTERTLIFVSNLLKELEIAGELTLPNIDKNSFNEDAVFSNKSSIQGAIDDLFNTGNTDIAIPDDEVQGNVAAFDNSGGAGEGGGEGGGAVDIDALFGGGAEKNDSEPAGQDDIDKLFS